MSCKFDEGGRFVRLWDAMMSVYSGQISTTQPADLDRGIADPLRTAVVVNQLIEAGGALGYTFHLSTDFLELGKARLIARNSGLSPMFDPAVNPNLQSSAFWMKAVDADGAVMALQGYRMDIAVPSLAEWALGWMMGLYARRREMIVPRQGLPPEHSLTSSIRGKVAYLGEFWVDRHGKKTLSDIFARLGVLLSFIKWNPEAVWALTSTSMATRGFMVRAGLAYTEPSFLTWQWSPDGAESEEWIALATRRHLEFLVAEMTFKEEKYQPSSSR